MEVSILHGKLIKQAKDIEFDNEKVVTIMAKYTKYVIFKNQISYHPGVDTLYCTYGNGNLDMAYAIINPSPDISIMLDENNNLSGIEIYDLVKNHCIDGISDWIVISIDEPQPIRILIPVDQEAFNMILPDQCH